MSNMGDGDMVDPDDLNDEELAGSASRSAAESAAAADAADATGENDVPERDGEFDAIDTLSALDFETLKLLQQNSSTSQAPRWTTPTSTSAQFLLSAMTTSRLLSVCRPSSKTSADFGRDVFIR
jgi:hypothetical protein